jgi:sugar phosphate isomerase/epimerase
VYYDYRSMIRYVHLKDFIGGRVERDANGVEIDRSGHRNFVPLGEGVVNFGAVMDVLDEIRFDGYLMAELNWTESASRQPRECASVSKKYLDGLLASRRPA